MATLPGCWFESATRAALLLRSAVGPVSEPDLASPRQTRWLALSAAAGAEGVAARFAFPLRVGAVHLGAITCTGSTPGSS
jgi:hypothetical protein